MTLLASLVSAMSNSSKTSNTFTQTLLLGMFLARSVCLTVVRDVCACILLVYTYTDYRENCPIQTTASLPEVYLSILHRTCMDLESKEKSTICTS